MTLTGYPMISLAEDDKDATAQEYARTSGSGIAFTDSFGISYSGNNGESISGMGGISYSWRGKARSGEGGILIFRRFEDYDDENNCRRVRLVTQVAKVGEDGIEPHVFYKLDDSGKIVKA